MTFDLRIRPEPETEPARSNRPRNIVIALVLAGVVASFAFYRGLQESVPTQPRTITDTAFVEKANQLCKRHLSPLQNERPEKREEQSIEQTARKVETSAREMDTLVMRIRALPVASSDRADVDHWLQTWNAYSAVGHRYAAAVRSGEDDNWNSIARKGDPLSRELFSFTRANGLTDCRL